jgi:hypothetical protein
MDRAKESDFVKVTWSQCKPGDSVYLAGTHLGDFHAYGPHEVVDPVKMILKNCKGVEFLQYQEILCTWSLLKEEESANAYRHKKGRYV